MTKQFALSLFMLFGFCANNALFSQCGLWTGLANENEITDWHSIYRDALKTEDHVTAFEYWQKVYEVAPAADGNRDFHYTDGIKIYKHLLKNETDEAKKKEHKEAIIRLYDEATACYESQSIKIKKATDDSYTQKCGYLMGRKGFDMFYDLNSNYSVNQETFAKGLELAGNNAEYIVLEPYANIIVYQFTKDKVTKDEAIAVHKQLNDIAKHNIENNEKYGAYYESALARTNAKFDEIADSIFDCAYFKKKYEPKYQEAPDDIDNIKNIFQWLKKYGCTDSDPLMAEIKGKYERWASATNAAKQAEFEANNPGILAKKAYDSGDYNGAISKYNDAISGEMDNSKKAGYMFSKASIQFRKLKKYGDARRTALESAKLRPNWGRPYMQIGDMYATTARSCGDSWNQRLAILAAMDKYAYAKKIDPSVADEANEKIGKYRSSMPSQEDAFMQGLKKGSKVKVGCWIGETVSLRF